MKTLKTEYLQLHTFEPLSYYNFNYFIVNTLVVIAYCSGILIKAGVLGISYISLRDLIDRPETITIEIKELQGINPKSINPSLENLFAGELNKGEIPELTDGNTPKFIVSFSKILQFAS